MKYRVTISMIILILIASCSTSKSKVNGEQYVKCLPELFGSDLSQLVKSFNGFVNRNHNGQQSNFISSILNRDFPEQSEFNKLDFNVAKQLRKNNFRDFIYTEYEEKLSDSGVEIAPPRTGDSFIVETTLSGSYVNKVATRAKKEGYQVTLIYIFLDSADLCVERIKTRVLKGGHHVPENDIRRRFTRSLENFWNNFTEIASEWVLLYNGQAGFQPVAIGVERECSIENNYLFKKFKLLVDEASQTTQG